MSSEVRRWDDIKDAYVNGCVLLGNGSSIAVHSGFLYSSLRSAASERGFLAEAEPLFKTFDTPDFELVLRLLWQADRVNTALDAQVPLVRKSYETVRTALIQTVRATHLEHGELRDNPFAPAESTLRTKNAFLASFNLVVSLNYDLLVYWARMAEAGNSRDCFGREDDRLVFQGLPDQLAANSSYVLYPHGNLCLLRDRFGDELKMRGGDSTLLENTLKAWESGEFIPLFVSEGTSEQKMRSIRSSAYLSAAYAGMRKPTHNNALVLYGWGMGEHDAHILEALKGRQPQRVAVSAFRLSPQQCDDLDRQINRIFGVAPDLFAADSVGPWSGRSAGLAAKVAAQ